MGFLYEIGGDFSFLLKGISFLKLKAVSFFSGSFGENGGMSNYREFFLKWAFSWEIVIEC